MTDPKNPEDYNYPNSTEIEELFDSFDYLEGTEDDHSIPKEIEQELKRKGYL